MERAWRNHCSYLSRKRRTVSIIVVGLVLLAAACTGNSPSARDLARSIARVSGSACSRTIEGSAVLVSDGLYLTSAHVVAGAEPDLHVRLPAGPDVAAKVVGFDPNRDLALLKAPGETGVPLPIGSTDAGDRGSIAAVTSNLDVELIRYEVIRQITATGDDIYGEGDVERQAVEVAANVSPGFSGAALVNHEGELVGVVFAESRTRESTYAVSSSEMEAFIGETDTATEVTPGRCP